MSRETFYFTHDYNSRSDPKLSRLKMKMGMDGIGIYWCIIEMLYEQNGYIPLIDIETIAFELHTECERIKSVLQNFELFKYEGEYFYSESVLRRLENRNKKSSGARKSALKRWHPDVSKPDANAMPTQCEGNAIKERKEKERKGKKRKEKERKENTFIPPDLNSVISYFTENGYTKESATKAFRYYESGNWKDSQGHQVKNWKGKMIAVWFKPENKIKEEKPYEDPVEKLMSQM